MDTMIKHLTGTLLETIAGEVVIDVEGVGYAVLVSEQTRAEVAKQKTVSLWTYLSVRENALELYGFLQKEELEAFMLLIDVPGIGPKGAIAILSLDTVEKLMAAISAGDTSYLTAVSGVGPKSARKIVIELQDKLQDGLADAHTPQDVEVLDALRSLGYTQKESRDALKKVPEDITDPSERIKKALTLLSKH